MQSLADQSIGSDLTQADIDTLRAEDVQRAADEAAQQAEEAYIGDTQARARRALNIFETKWKFDLNDDPSVQWDDIKQEAEWAIAWTESA